MGEHSVEWPKKKSQELVREIERLFLVRDSDHLAEYVVAYRRSCFISSKASIRQGETFWPKNVGHAL